MGALAMVLTKTLPARIYADLEIVRKIMNWRDATVYRQRNAYPVEQIDFVGVREMIKANMESYRKIFYCRE